MGVLFNQIIKIIILVHLVSQTFSSSCYITYAEWANDYHLILTRGENNTYELFRGRSVPVNADIILLCNNEQQPLTVTCISDNQFNVNLPLQDRCKEKDSLPVVRIVEEASHCPFTLYKIGYNIQIAAHSQFIESYQVCFDEKHLRPLFTINKVYPRGGAPLYMLYKSDDIFHIKDIDTISRRAAEARFNALLTNSTRYRIIKKRQLTPMDDFNLDKLKRSTFDMMNVIPMFKSIDRGNMQLMTRWIQTSRPSPPTVCTGVLNCDLDTHDIQYLTCVLKLRDENGQGVPMFLADDRKVPIPLWVYKIVKYENKENSFVFLTLNNAYRLYYNGVPEHICKGIQCPQKFNDDFKEGMTFCCDHYDFINRNAPYLRDVC